MAQRTPVDVDAPVPAGLPGATEACPTGVRGAGAPASPPPDDGSADVVPDGVDPLSYRVFRAFTGALRAHGRLMIRILGDEGMHPGQAFCLRALARHDGMSQRDLAATLHVSRPTVTAMLQRMERAGMVRRVADEEDQRVTRVHLTDTGRCLERELSRTLLSYSGRILDPLPAPDRLELARLLGLMTDNIAAALAERADGSRTIDRVSEESR